MRRQSSGCICMWLMQAYLDRKRCTTAIEGGVLTKRLSSMTKTSVDVCLKHGPVERDGVLSAACA